MCGYKMESFKNVVTFFINNINVETTNSMLTIKIKLSKTSFARARFDILKT